MKCPSCEHEIDDLAVAQYASEQLHEQLHEQFQMFCPEDVQRELWRLGLIACTEVPTWDHVAEMLRGFR